MSPSKEMIQSVRKSAGLSQAKAAEMVYLSGGFRWSEYERGIRSPDAARWELFLIKVGLHEEIELESTDVKKIAEELRIKALNKFTSELDRCKLLAAHYSLLGKFDKAVQCHLQCRLEESR